MPVSLTGSQPGNYREVIEPFGSTVTTYTVTSNDMGKIITTRSATAATTITLPAVADQKGACVTILNIDNTACTIKAAAAAKMVTFNDATASSVIIGHLANKRIGAMAHCFCDGTSWFVSASVDPTSSTVPTVA